MEYIAQIKLNTNISYYESLLPGVYVFYVKNLAYDAPEIIDAAELAGYKILDYNKRNTSMATNWLVCNITSPKNSNVPGIHYLWLNIGTKGVQCWFLNYNKWDQNADEVDSQDDMQFLVDNYIKPLGLNGDKPITSLHKYFNIYWDKQKDERGLMWKLVKSLHLYGVSYKTLVAVKRGGFIGLTKKEGCYCPQETHIDYHQMYAYEMISNKFPVGIPQVVSKYIPAKNAFYMLTRDTNTILQLKDDGYDVLSSWEELKNQKSANGKYLVSDIYGFTSIDLDIILDNYDVIGEQSLTDCIVETVYWTDDQLVSGETLFGEIVNSLYSIRVSEDAKNHKSVKGFSKLANEVNSGVFQMQTLGTSKKWAWKGLTKAYEMPVLDKKSSFIGSFITAYGRRDLNWLLHQFKPQQVIGWDTDCVFINDNNVPESVLSRFGEGIGQLHYDGIYKDVSHYRLKWYQGFDIEAKDTFVKRSGVSKNGIVREWDEDTKRFKLVKINEFSYNYELNKDGEMIIYEE